MATRTRRVRSGNTRPRRRGPLTGLWGTRGRPRVYRTEAIRDALIEAGGNMTAAAQALGCDDDTVRRRVRQEPELIRVVAVLKSAAAKQTYERRARRERAQALERQREALGMSPAALLRPPPRVVVEYREEAGGLVRRSCAEGEAPPAPLAPEAGTAPPAFPLPEINRTSDAPHTGRERRWIPAPEWAAGWVRVEVIAPTSFKHYGELGPGDLVAVPRAWASGWLASGLARPVGESGDE